MKLLSLAWKSLWHRRGTALLTLLAISISVALLLGVERVRQQTRASFQNTVSGTDLMVGARGNPVQILLSTVFHLGFPTNNLTWASVERIRSRPEVAWTIPLSVGDTHAGFRIIGTSEEFMEHFRYGRKKTLELADGKALEADTDAIIGSQVAAKLSYKVGSSFVATHGAGNESFVEHDHAPFNVVGVLKPTGTPVDRAIYVPLEGYDLMHRGFAGAHDHAGHDHGDPLADRMVEGENRSISSLMVGLKSRNLVLSIQREINQDPREPMTAVLPGDALMDLWSVTGTAENALLLVSMAVVAVGLVGMLTNLLVGLRERRREIAILRSVGARPVQIFGLVIGEAMLLTAFGVLIGAALAYGGLALASPTLTATLGVTVEVGLLSRKEWERVGWVMLAGFIAGAIPAFGAYRASLAEGMSVKL